MYCGDETGAFIGDVGSHTARFGYGGEDCPKVVVPSASYYSQHYDADGNSKDNGTSNTNKRRGKYSAPVSLMRLPPNHSFSVGGGGGDAAAEDDDGFVPIYQSLNSNNKSYTSTNSNNDDGLIQDIDAWASLWEYSYQSLCVRGKGKHVMGHKYSTTVEPELQPESSDSAPTTTSSSKSQTISSQSSTMDGPIDHPLLAADSTRYSLPTNIQEKQRAQMLEILFESLSAPSAYIAPSAMLSSFAYGRQTSLVVDVGHAGSRVTPLVDGYCLSNGSVSSGRGGRWLGCVQQGVLEGKWAVDGNTNAVNKWNGWGDNGAVPPCQENGIVPRYDLRDKLTEKLSAKRHDLLKQSSFHSMTVHETMYEMMTSSHIAPLVGMEEESAPFCGYGSSSKDGETAEGDGDVEMEDVKTDDSHDDDDEEDGCYTLPDGTRVNFSQSKAGKDLCRLPVSRRSWCVLVAII